ncbi:MAG: AI-2E family transporter [Alphaproteobacteria bacterium]|nr:AI-2E family transporter [Alphaproteobacteria bacterium]MCW5743940.1 AI-2E family transporter [Alphaproteobacteria bacterium]
MQPTPPIPSLLTDELPGTQTQMPTPPPDDQPMPLPSNPIVLLLAGVFGLLAIFALRLVAEIAIPIAMAFMLSLVLQPAMRVLVRHHLPRGLAALVVLVALCGGVAGLALTLANPVSEWAERLPSTLDKVEERFSGISRIVGLIQRAGRQVEARIADDAPATALTVKGPPLSSRILAGTGQIVVGLATTVLLLFFLLLSGDIFLRRLVEVLPTFSDKKQAVEISGEIRVSVSGYLLTISLMNAAVGISTGLAVWACGLPDPILWGSLAFVCNYIPFLGTVVSCSMLLIVGVATFEDPLLAILPTMLYLAISLLEGQFITPLLLARRFILNPVIVIVSIVFWYWMWGIPGAVLAVPMLATIKIVCDRIRGLAAFGHFLAAEPRTA